MPELAQDEQVTRMTIGITDGKTTIGRGEEGNGNGLWEDDESKSFYENIKDLCHLVPAILLGQKSVPSADLEEGDKVEPSASTSMTSLKSDDAADEKPPASTSKPKPSSEVAKSGSVEQQDISGLDEKVETSSAQIAFSALTSKLVNCLSRDAVEQLAMDFVFINNKGTRRQLIQALLGVSRQRLDLLPYYSRLIATLNPYWPEIGTSVVEELESSFHRHQKRKDQIFIEEKLKVLFGMFIRWSN